MVHIAKLAKIVGSQFVTDDQASLKDYSSDMSFVNPVRPAQVVKPKSSAEIHEIVALAKENQTPLVPVSSGAPHFRGDTVPGSGGAIVVDLSRMKNIIHIDRQNRVAMFEPGVTFAELNEAVSKEGLRLNMPLLPRRTKSVVGSLLEREPVLMPAYHWDIADPLACTEVIFGTDEMFRTGAAAGSGSIEEQWAAGGAQKEAAGPSSASWYRLIQGAQGTMGIVTWVSARCELRPKAEAPYFVGSPDLDKLLDAMHWLIRLRLVNECLILNRANLAVIMAAQGKPQFNQMQTTLPPWILFFNIAAYDYLPEERIKGQSLDMQDLMQRLGLKAVQALGNLSAAEFLKIIQQPSVEPYWKLQPRGNCQDIFFLSLLEKIPDMVKTMSGLAGEAGYPSSQIGVYLQPIVQGANFHCEFNLFYNPADPGEVKQVKDLNACAVKKLLAGGAFFSRPYGENSALILNRDAATMKTLKQVKSIVDPGNIMNPGKLCF
jgi:FAD/FMN-containing dehydrogenase